MKIFIFLIYVFIIKSYNTLGDDKNSSPNLAVLNLKLFHSENINDIFTSLDYLHQIHSSLPYLEVQVGKSIKNDIIINEEIEERIKSQKQFLPIFLELDEFSFYIDDNYFINNQKKLFCKYSSELSSSYEVINDIESKYRNSIYASDYFKIYSDISLNKYNFVKLIFRHSFSFSLNKTISYICGKTGLLYNSEKQDEYSQLNFIHQIHSNLKNVDYSFMFNFKENNNEEENENGLLIIGAESYIKNNKNYELYSFYTKSKNTMAKQEWRFDVESLKIGDKNIVLNDEEFIIKLDIEGIEIPYFFQEILDEHFLNNYYIKNICVKEELYYYYRVIYCHSNNFTNNDINNFPKIQFSKKEIGFDFSFFGNELFYRKGNKYFLKLISIVETKARDFKLGRMFLRKYNVIFNSDSKMMTFYKINESKEGIEGKEKNSGSNNNALKILSYVFICLLFLVIGLYLGRKFCIFRRKRYAMELDDNDYVYESSSKNYKDNKKLMEFKSNESII